MPIDMSNYKMIYEDQVYNVINIFIIEKGGHIESVRKPAFITATVIDENGEIVIFKDEAWMFKFVRR